MTFISNNILFVCGFITIFTYTKGIPLRTDIEKPLDTNVLNLSLDSWPIEIADQVMPFSTNEEKNLAVSTCKTIISNLIDPKPIEAFKLAKAETIGSNDDDNNQQILINYISAFYSCLTYEFREKNVDLQGRILAKIYNKVENKTIKLVSDNGENLEKTVNKRKTSDNEEADVVLKKNSSKLEFENVRRDVDNYTDADTTSSSISLFTHNWGERAVIEHPLPHLHFLFFKSKLIPPAFKLEPGKFDEVVLDQ